MKITLENISKKFKLEWVFKNLSANFDINTPTAILGKNGSGKSTLLKVISGSTLPFQGNVVYHINTNQIKSTSNQIYKHISIAAPYMDLIEDYTLSELLNYHQKYKPFVANYSSKEVLDILQLNESSDKPLKHFSSGMTQRVKLGLAILSNTPVLLLDEPTSNLDKKSIEWYGQLLSKYHKNRVLIICSNSVEAEYSLCKQKINIEDYK